MKIEWFTVPKQSSENEILNLPLTANIGNSDSFVWETFFIDIFHDSMNRFIEEIKEAFSQDNFWSNFSIHDPKELPKGVDALESCDQRELEELILHYGIDKLNYFIGSQNFEKEDINKKNLKFNDRF